MLSVIDSLDEMEKLKPEWNRILCNYSNSTPFQSWEWNYGVAKTLFNSELLRIVVYKNREGKLTGIAPLKLRNYWFPGIKILEFIGTRYSDYLDFIVNDDCKYLFMEELFKWIKNNKEWDIINFVSLRQETIEIFSKYFQFECTKFEVCPYICLPPSFNEYKNTLSKNHKKNIRRSLNDLNLEGRIEYKKSNREDFGNNLNIFFDLHQKRQKQKGERGHFNDKVFKEQFRFIANLMYEVGLLKIGSLKIDSKIASIQLNLMFNNKEYTYLSGLDSTFSIFSPGILLEYYMIEDAIQSGAKVYDFLQGSEPYKYKWTKEQFQLYKVFISQKKIIAFFWKLSQNITYFIHNNKFLKKMIFYMIKNIK